MGWGGARRAGPGGETQTHKVRARNVCVLAGSVWVGSVQVKLHVSGTEG